MAVSGTGLPSAVDEARDTDGALPRWKKNEIGKDVRAGLGEPSGSGPAVEDEAVGLGDGEWSFCSAGRHEEASALAASVSSAVASRGAIGRGACGVLYTYMAGICIERHGQGSYHAACRGSSRTKRTAQQAIRTTATSRGTRGTASSANGSTGQRVNVNGSTRWGKRHATCGIAALCVSRLPALGSRDGRTFEVGRRRGRLKERGPTVARLLRPSAGASSRSQGSLSALVCTNCPRSIDSMIQ